MHRFIVILMLATQVFAYTEDSFADWAAETARCLFAIAIFGGFPIIIGVAICLVVWFTKLAAKGAQKIPDITKPNKPRSKETKWNRLEK